MTTLVSGWNLIDGKRPAPDEELGTLIHLLVISQTRETLFLDMVAGYLWTVPLHTKLWS